MDNQDFIKVIGLAVLAWSGFLVWAIKYLIDRALRTREARLDKQDDRLDNHSRRIDDQNQKLHDALLDLSKNYVRREDWVHWVTRVESKIDNLATTITKWRGRK
ncbi:MAG: hypothetical protein AAF442_05360 [Pseudomonadota bacterium]